jgi:hypothetical protein
VEDRNGPELKPHCHSTPCFIGVFSIRVALAAGLTWRKPVSSSVPDRTSRARRTAQRRTRAQAPAKWRDSQDFNGVEWPELIIPAPFRFGLAVFQRHWRTVAGSAFPKSNLTVS